MKKGKILIIEGVSCVGKTTICERLKKEQNYLVVPEAIRYIEKITGKKQEEALPTPTNEDDENKNQQILFDIELQKMIEANNMTRSGQNVIIDKSAIAVMGTAFAFEKIKNYNGTFDASVTLFQRLLDTLDKNGLRFCDMFILLDAEYATIKERNFTRSHILDDFWISSSLLAHQKLFLNSYFDKCNYHKQRIDTTFMNKEDAYQNICSVLLNNNMLSNHSIQEKLEDRI